MNNFIIFAASNKKQKNIMENIEKLYLRHLQNSLEYASENLTSLDLLRVRNIIILLRNEIINKLNEKTATNDKKENNGNE